MKIVFTGGGSGGHFYPIIAVAEEVNTIVEEKKLLRPGLFYIGPEPYDAAALYENGIEFLQSPAGKTRRYFSFLNILDFFKTAFGIVRSIWQLYRIYPDIVFSKGGYASFPTLVAARILRIPVMIHESDVVAGRVNAWAGKFANKVALSYAETAESFSKEKTALTGNPIRQNLQSVLKEGGGEFLELDESVPTLLILGGSQGAQSINNVILDMLPTLLEKYQVIHQTGTKNLAEVQRTADFILREHAQKNRYHVFDFLSESALRMAAGAASLVVSRAGSGSIFEVAAWGLPAILIPIGEEISHDQRKNAFAYARGGGAIVIEQKNLTPHLLASEIDRLLSDTELINTMQAAAKKFATPNAARTIAEGLVDVALSHERE